MTRWGAAALLLLALLTWGRVALVDHLHDQGYFAKYPVFADRILAGELPRDRIGDLSPLYLWLTVLLRAMGMSLHAIRTTQIVALSLGALLCAIAAKRIGGWPAAIAAAVLILGNRAALVTASELEPETLILVLVAGALAALPRRPWLAGLLVGLAAIARPVAVVTLVLVAAWMFFRSRRDALRFVAAALPPIAIVLAVNLALIGNAIIMSPGTVFYEGNNPLSTGCAGVMPRIVAEMNAESPEPDYLHVAYRIIAARATGQPMSPALANRYWSGKALAWMRHEPLRALELFGWKALLSIHNYDIYDLATSKKKAIELEKYPALPFGLAFVLAVVSLGFGRPQAAPTLFAAATLLAMIAFTVSSRQRNAMLPALAIMGGVAVASARKERALLLFGVAAIATPLLSIEGNPVREDRYNWESTLQEEVFRSRAIEARERGDRIHAAQFATAASILAIDKPPLVGERTLRDFALAARTTMPARRFDLALALIKAGAFIDADRILASIDDYRPQREDRAVASVAYYRAICAIAMHKPPDVAAAVAEAPGDPNVLALAGDRRTLDELHDPFTRNLSWGHIWKNNLTTR